MDSWTLVERAIVASARSRLLRYGLYSRLWALQSENLVALNM